MSNYGDVKKRKNKQGNKINIEESKIINYNNEVIWILRIYDRDSNDIRIFYVDKNRTKECLFPIIKKNIYIIIIYKMIIYAKKFMTL